MTEPTKIAVCIGCGCDDLHACSTDIPIDIEDLIERDFAGLLPMPVREFPTTEPCHWLRVDRDAGLGVCSACSGSVVRWDAGGRDGPTSSSKVWQDFQNARTRLRAGHPRIQRSGRR